MLRVDVLGALDSSKVLAGGSPTLTPRSSEEGQELASVAGSERYDLTLGATPPLPRPDPDRRRRLQAEGRAVLDRLEHRRPRVAHARPWTSAPSAPEAVQLTTKLLEGLPTTDARAQAALLLQQRQRQLLAARPPPLLPDPSPADVAAAWARGWASAAELTGAARDAQGKRCPLNVPQPARAEVNAALIRPPPGLELVWSL